MFVSYCSFPDGQRLFVSHIATHVTAERKGGVRGGPELRFVPIIRLLDCRKGERGCFGEPRTFWLSSEMAAVALADALRTQKIGDGTPQLVRVTRRRASSDFVFNPNAGMLNVSRTRHVLYCEACAMPSCLVCATF